MLCLKWQDPEVSEKLRQATDDSIVYGLDTISENGSVQLAQEAFSSKGGHLICLLFKLGEPARDNVKTESTLAYTALGADQSFGPASFKSSAKDRANQVEASKILTKLFANGTLKPLEVTDLGGLETVEKGMKMLQSEYNNSRSNTDPTQSLTYGLRLDAENKTKLVHTIA